MRLTGPLLAAALALLPATAPAAAPAEDATTRKKVQTYLDLAADLFKSGDYEGALSELRRAENLSGLAVVRFNIARCLEELHRAAEAVIAYEKYLGLQDGTDGAADRQRRAKDAVARLAGDVFGGLEVTCPVSGSSVLVLGMMQVPEECPWRHPRVPAGTYEVQTFSPGLAPFVTKVTVPAGRTVLVASQALPAAPVVARPPPPAVVTPPEPQLPPPPPVYTAPPPPPLMAPAPVAPQPQPAPRPQPAAQPQAAPQPQPQPAVQPKPAAASATSKPGAAPAVTLDQHRAGEVTRPAAKPTGRSTGKVVTGTVLTVLGVGGLATMGYFLYAGSASNEKIRDGGFSTSADILEQEKAGKKANLAAIITGIAGGALALPGVIVLATSGSSEAPATAVLAPAAFPSGAGVVLSGTLP